MSTPETPTAAARYAHEYLVGSSLVQNVVGAAGEYDAKTDPGETTSLAAHLLNAMTIGVNAFVYNAIGGGRDITELKEELEVLASALVLHDTNKYILEAYGIETDGNTREAFETYFDEGDDFGVEEFLGKGYRDDLLYLVQRTELTEDSRETRGTDTEFVGLDRYCRLGDQVASVILREGIEGGYETLARKVDNDEIHLVELNAVEQPVLNDELIGRTKEVISGEDGGEENGVVIGSTPDRVLYLGEGIKRDELRERVQKRLSAKLIEGEQYSFSCKLTWNSFDYDILAEFALDPERKEEIIAAEFRELLHGGTAGVEGFERIPEEFDRYFGALAKAIYIDGRSEFADDDIQEAYDEIYEEQGPQKVKIHFIAHLVRNLNEYQGFLDTLATDVRPELHADLDPESDAISTVVDRFFDATEPASLPSKEDMCFLCGAPAETEYQKGLSAVYRTQEFSRRVPPHEKYKSICEVCNLEYALLAEHCERANVSLNANIGIAYYYFDDFLGDIRLQSGLMGFQQDETLDLSEGEVMKSLLRPQYYIQPFRFGGHPAMGEKNHRMVVVRQLMQRAQAVGMKVVLGRPFTRFEGADKAFVDEDAIREQEVLGLDSAARFGPLPPFVERDDDQPESHLRRALALHKLIATVGYEAGMSNPYLQLDRDTFHSLTDFAVRNHDNAPRLSELRSYLDAYHPEQLMDMKTVARRGIDLFGKQFDSKYKKTRIFREVIDAFLSGKNQRMSEDDLLKHVEAQVYAIADREDYAGYATPEQAEAFVDAVRSYLVENDLYTLKKLSDWENALVNSYLYAYEQVLYEDSGEEDAEPEEVATN